MAVVPPAGVGSRLSEAAPHSSGLPPSAAALEIIEDVAPKSWDEYVSAHPRAASYHQHAWRQVFERAFGHRTIYLGARRGGALAGVLPLVEMRSWLFGKFLVSLPFVNYGGVLADDASVERALFDRAGEIADHRGLSHVELRHFEAHFPGEPARRHKVTMLLPLARDVDSMWTRLDRKVRNQVRKAEKSGLTFEAGGRELLDAFYPVFATNMRDLGTPVYSKRLFAEVFDSLRDQAIVFVVRAGSGAAVAAGIGLRFRDTLEMPWASSLRSHRERSPNNLLYWGAIAHAIQTGATVFDFGRSTPDSGPHRFKVQWGAEAMPLCWEYALVGDAKVPGLGPGDGRFSGAIEVWKRMPLAMTNVVGPAIIRSIP